MEEELGDMMTKIARLSLVDEGFRPATKVSKPVPRVANINDFITHNSFNVLGSLTAGKKISQKLKKVERRKALDLNKQSSPNGMAGTWPQGAVNPDAGSSAVLPGFGEPSTWPQGASAVGLPAADECFIAAVVVIECEGPSSCPCCPTVNRKIIEYKNHRADRRRIMHEQ